MSKQLHENNPANRPLLAIGTMSGTSMDGIDVAMIRTDGQYWIERGLGQFFPYRPEERQMLEQALQEAQDWTAPQRNPAIDAMITKRHYEAVSQFIADHGVPLVDISVIGFHGHTLVHRPDAGFTVQAGDAQALAAALNLSVVADLRQADIAAGGQGAPLVPIYHAALAAASGLALPMAVVNIGGIANLTCVAPESDLLAFDIGPGNALLDEWMLRHTGTPMDRDGAAALAGNICEPCLEQMLLHPFLAEAPPKSLDRKAFSLEALAGQSVADGAATLAAYTAMTIARSQRFLPAVPKHWVISGGGANNPAIMAQLTAQLAGKVMTAEQAGWSSAFMEAEAFAYLAVRHLYDLPITFPGTTGAKEALAGGELYL